LTKDDPKTSKRQECCANGGGGVSGFSSVGKKEGEKRDWEVASLYKKKSKKPGRKKQSSSSRGNN